MNSTFRQKKEIQHEDDGKMEALVTSFEAVTTVFRGVLSSLNIQPESYRFLFPAGKDAATIRKLVAQGIFPTIPHLAPAITWCIFLSVIRYMVQLSLLKVFIENNACNYLLNDDNHILPTTIDHDIPLCDKFLIVLHLMIFFLHHHYDCCYTTFS